MSEDGYRRRGRAVRKRKTISGAPPGPRRADQRRAAIVDAAAKLFVEKGFQATTVDDIATQAGFAKGTFYHYFPTKLELLDALRDRFSDEFQDRTRAAADACAPDDWTGRLRSWIEEAVVAYFDMSALHDVVFHGAEMPLRHAMGDVPVVRDLAQLLTDGTSAGAGRRSDGDRGRCGSHRRPAVVAVYPDDRRTHLSERVVPAIGCRFETARTAPCSNRERLYKTSTIVEVKRQYVRR
jgi:AcrR family transcriptional regulator